MEISLPYCHTFLKGIISNDYKVVRSDRRNGIYDLLKTKSFRIALSKPPGSPKLEEFAGGEKPAVVVTCDKTKRVRAGIEPHFFAGFTGGSKVILQGACTAPTGSSRAHSSDVWPRHSHRQFHRGLEP